MARAEGFHYTDLINEILNLALDRVPQQVAGDGRGISLFQRPTLRVAVPAWDGL
jgi:hypothetical protein